MKTHDKSTQRNPSERAKPTEVVLSRAERDHIIRQREGFWYPEPTRVQLLKALDDLAGDPARHRETSVAIIAESNGGKSALCSRYIRTHPVTRGSAAMIVPAVYLNMSGIRRVERLSVKLLASISAPDPESGDHDKRIERFIELAKRVKLGLIFLDEFHDCADTTGRGKPFLRCIKDLLINGLRVVPMGTEEVAAVLESDPQFTQRFDLSTGRLQRLSDPSVIKALMSYVCGLSDDQITNAAVNFTMGATKGVIGHTLDLTERTFLRYGNLNLASLEAQRARMGVLDHLV